jgi:hypothetical protein
MKAGMKVLWVRNATIAVALLAFTLGGSAAARAADTEPGFVQEQEMVLVSAKSLEAMETRIAYLEEAVNALTKSVQHIDAHRLCVADDNGAETCLTKAQLDGLILNQASHSAEAARPAVLPADSVEPTPEPAARTETDPEPAAGAAVKEAEQEEPDHTGSVATAAINPQQSVLPTSENADPSDPH